MWSKMSKVVARDTAFRVAHHSQFGGCSLPPNLIALYCSLQPPFRTSSERSFAWSVCTAIAQLVAIETKHLQLHDAYVACAIVIHRYQLTRDFRPPPRYNECQRPTHML